MIPRLRLSEFVRSGEAYHFARVTLSAKPAKEMHRHSFHEIFWVEEGDGIHLINGIQRRLQPCMCFCVHADDAHSLRAMEGDAMRIVNLAFTSSTWLHIRKRYFDMFPDYFIGDARSRELRLNPPLMAELLHASGELGHGERSKLKIERFLINLFYLLSKSRKQNGMSRLPDWLENACRRIRENKAFAGGVPAFARLAGRCPEHLARQVRYYMGRTPTDIVNEARLSYACGALSVGMQSISEIALDCGINNLSHFYGLFRRNSVHRKVLILRL